ncbi:MAG: trigger factor [Chitinophagales bacterium]
MSVVTRENIGTLTDKIIVKIQKDDYLPSFEKALKEYSKKANIHGFRKGMVPAGLIRKMYGNSVFTDEVLRSVEKELTTYMANEKLDIFAQPLPLPENDARQIDMSNPDDYSFAFEVGLKPAFELPEMQIVKPEQFSILVTPAMIDEEIDRLQVRNGKMTEPESVANEEYVLNVHFAETDADGNPVEGGIQKDNSLLVKYFNEEYRKLWIGKKKEDYLILQPAAAFDEKEREWIISDLGIANDATGAERFFKVTITKVGFVEKSGFDEEFFKTVYPAKEIKTTDEFRISIQEDIQKRLDQQTRAQLQHTLYHELLDKTRIEFPEAFLKRWLLNGGDKPKSQEEVEHEFPAFTNQLKWSLILDKVVRDHQIEVTADDIKALAKEQLLGYLGMQAQHEEQPWISDYINRMMQDKKFIEDSVQRIRTDKVLNWAETQVSPVVKEISLEEFGKMQEEHQHHHH